MSQQRFRQTGEGSFFGDLIYQRARDRASPLARVESSTARGRA